MTENTNGARTLRAVLHPSRFEPFPGADDAGALTRAWERRRPWVLANMAHAAYHAGGWVEGKMRRLGASFVRAYDRDGAQAFLAVWPGQAVLAFRGTEPDESIAPSPGLRRAAERALRVPIDLRSLLANDLLADLRFKKTNLGGARVHCGFLGELEKLWRPAVLPDLEKHVGPEVPVYVTGHSLGGAMATLAGMLHPFARVVTFGEPKVGSGVGRAFQAGVHTRYVNGDDPVARLPPSWWPFRYRHHGDVVPLVDEEGPDVRFDHSIVDYAVKLARR